MVKRSHCYTLVLLFFILGKQYSIAQSLEIGLKIAFTNDKLKIDENTVIAPLVDRVTQISVENNNMLFTKVKSPLGIYAKFYPTNNNLFFMQDYYSMVYEHNYTQEYNTIKTNGEVNQDGDIGFTKFQYKKRITNLLIGYDFPKTKKGKFYLLGGLQYSNQNLNSFTPNPPGKEENMAHYESDASKIQSYYQQLKRSNIGFVTGFGLKQGRLSTHLQFTLNPFIKNTTGITQNTSVLQFDVSYCLFKKNLLRTQYQSKNTTHSKTKLSGSKAKLIFIVFSEGKIYARLSQFSYQDKFLISGGGYLKIDVTKSPEVSELPGLGLGYQVKLRKSFWFKNTFHQNRTIFTYQKEGILEGGLFEAHSNTYYYIPINDNTSKMETKLGHLRVNLSLCYNSFKKNSLFAEAGLQINRWTYVDNDISVDGGTGTVEMIEYPGFRQNLALKKQVLGVGATVGYKFNNLLIYIACSQTLGQLNTPSESATMGKFSDIKGGVAYQFSKFYFNKK
ncbi:MAG: hypothetical protein Q8M29_19095 [Bacteroidota bacterium]|nr:hypothetical protein [Bacteroidota bacterium]